MTSRNLCFKLMKEDLKRRVWTIAWTILSLFFAMVVPMAVICGELKEQIVRAVTDAERYRMMSDAAGLLYHNYAVALILPVTAVLWAFSGFHYLHNSRKTDFYHSLPVKRGQLFLAPYLNGLLVPFVCYAASELICVLLLVLRAGGGSGALGSLPWQNLFLNAVYYGLIYTTAVTAMMMTGNTAVALLAFGVFCVYGPALAALCYAYCSINFHTYSESVSQMGEIVRAVARDSSPVVNYAMAWSDFGDGEWSVWRGVPVMLATAALAVLSFCLYRLRPSEAAGRAMAFDRTKAPIRVLLTVPAGVAFALLFYLISNGKAGWLIFGGICGCLLTHCLTEIIYHFDFRKLISHRLQMAAAAVAVLAVALAGYYDWFGYDSWYPEADEIAEAGVIGPEESWVTYGDIGVYEDTSGQYYWDYMGANDYRMSHMKLTDTYPVAELARSGAEQAKEDRFKNRWQGETIIMRLKLKNGRTVYRTYRIRMDSGNNAADYAAIADSAEYKRGVYPILEQSASETAEVVFRQYNLQKIVETDEEGRAKLLAAYQKDLEELRVETMRHEIPIGTIRFTTDAMKAAAEHNRSAGYDDYNLKNRCFYPVYPSFERTLTLLGEAGIETERMDESNISSINIFYYDWDPEWTDPSGAKNRADAENPQNSAGNAGDTAEADTIIPETATQSAPVIIMYTDEETIRELAPGLCFEEYVEMNSFLDREEMSGNPDVTVTVDLIRDGTRLDRNGEYNGTWTETLACGIDLSKLSPETIEKYHLE